MSKFKVGQEVICIMPESKPCNRGAGWKLGRKFKIDHISPCYDSNNNIYWPTNHDGVFEPALELVNPFTKKQLNDL